MPKFIFTKLLPPVIPLGLHHLLERMVSSSELGAFCSLRASTPKLWYLPSVHLVPLGSIHVSIFFLLKFLGYLTMVIWSPDKACVISLRNSWMLLIWVYVCGHWNVLLTQTGSMSWSCFRCKWDIYFFVYRFFSSPSFPSLPFPFQWPPYLLSYLLPFPSPHFFSPLPLLP